jgi:hypothetical protein
VVGRGAVVLVGVLVSTLATVRSSAGVGIGVEVDVVVSGVRTITTRCDPLDELFTDDEAGSGVVTTGAAVDTGRADSGAGGVAPGAVPSLGVTPPPTSLGWYILRSDGLRGMLSEFAGALFPATGRVVGGVGV